MVAATILLSLLAVGGLLAGRRMPADPPAPDGVAAARDRLARRRGRLLMAGAVGAESVLLLGFTSLSAPPPTSLQTGSVRWLQAHQGDGGSSPWGRYRRTTARTSVSPRPASTTCPCPRRGTPISPNGSIRMPFPGSSPGEDGSIRPVRRPPRSSPPICPATSRPEFATSWRTRTAATCKASRSLRSVRPRGRQGPRLVHRDGLAEIWQLPAPAPLYSLRPATGGPSAKALPPGCAVHSSGWDQATVRCSRPSNGPEGPLHAGLVGLRRPGLGAGA